MSYIFELRTKLNCSQKEFAEFVGTSRPTLTRVERESKVLPPETNDYIRLLGFAIIQVDEGRETVTNLDPPTTNSKVFFEERNVAIASALIKCKTEMSAMKGNFDLARAARKYLLQIIANADSLEANRMGWLHGQAELQSMIMKKNDDLARHAMQVKIAQLELELNMNQEALMHA